MNCDENSRQQSIRSRTEYLIGKSISPACKPTVYVMYDLS